MSRPFLVNKQASLWVPCSGAVERTRTSDLLITNQLLYQLSYNGVVRGLAAWKKWNSILSPPENQVRAGRAPGRYLRHSQKSSESSTVTRMLVVRGK